MKRRVCVVTGSRADFGLLRGVMEAIRTSGRLQLQVVVTGMHLSSEFGMTCSEVEHDFTVDRKVEMLLSSDSSVGIAKSMGLGIIGFADALHDLRPDLLLLLGDRFEILSAASAALAARLPIAHLHGGEITEGAIDDAIRHALTKMSHLHFVATEEYRHRVLQLGENPHHVHLVGGLGIDAIKRLRLLDKDTLEQELGFKFGQRNLMITFHPVTLEQGETGPQMQALLDALDSLRDTNLIFTLPNADNDGRMLIPMIQDFVANRPHARTYPSLGQLRYLSCLQFVDGVVGNSSSGLLEAPTFKIGTINIGSRQQGRLKAESVIDCEAGPEAIATALQRLFSDQFQRSLETVRNPYGEGGAAGKIVGIIEDTPLDGLLRKSFHDLAYDMSTHDEQ
jgi:GDP/UDP-N,N'-diacetylbacillosamine 2-epimerase (hydrolysing)